MVDRCDAVKAKADAEEDEGGCDCVVGRESPQAVFVDFATRCVDVDSKTECGGGGREGLNAGSGGRRAEPLAWECAAG